MRIVVFHEEAEKELTSAAIDYESQRVGLGLDFQAELEGVVGVIQNDPERWPVHPQSGFRKCPLKRFPYNVFFLDLEGTTWIGAVAHHKRRPGNGTKRSPD